MTYMTSGSKALTMIAEAEYVVSGRCVRSDGETNAGSKQVLSVSRLKADIFGGAKRAKISLKSLNHSSSSLRGDPQIHLATPT